VRNAYFTGTDSCYMINETSQTQKSFENIYITSPDKYFEVVYFIGRINFTRNVHFKGTDIFPMKWKICINL